MNLLIQNRENPNILPDRGEVQSWSVVTKLRKLFITLKVVMEKYDIS